MNQYIFVLDENGKRITSFVDNTISKDELIEIAKQEFPNAAEYIYSEDGDSMLDEFMRGKLYVNGQFVAAPVHELTKAEKIAEIPDFPEVLRTEFLHCILSHHGELEFGSPKKPATMEALALAFADNTDAKLETMREFIEQGEKSGKAKENAGWIGFNKLLESNVRKSMF